MIRTSRLPLEVLLGLRYLRARGQRSSLSLFVWIGIGGVFLGVSALIVVLATMTGFQDGIKDKIIAANPHILVLEAATRGLGGAGPLSERIRPLPGVQSATPFVLQQALFTAQGGGATGGLLRGVDFGTPGVRAGLQSQLRMGSLDPLLGAGEPAVLLGRELGRTLGAIPGDYVTVISPQGAMTAVGLVPKMRRFRVAGLIEVGMYEYDSSLAFTTLAAAQEFAGLGDRVTGIEVKLDDPFDAKAMGRRIAAALGGGSYWLRDWMEMNKNLFAALQLEKLALFVIVTIIVLVAGFAIIGHLVLLVADKRKEIGILKAMGATSTSIASVFLAAGMLIGVVGTAAGSAFGLLLIWVQNTYKIIRFAGEVYQIDHLPMKLTGADFALVVGAALVISFLATLSPARRAAGLDPVDVLRYE